MKFYHRYVCGISVIWSHGPPTLRDFLPHMKSIHPNLKLSIGLEIDQFPFINILVTCSLESSMGHYLQESHPQEYLHAASHHSPAYLSSLFLQTGQEQAVTHRARIPNYNTSPPFSKPMITPIWLSPEHLGSLTNIRVISMEVDKTYHKDYISLIFIFRQQPITLPGHSRRKGSIQFINLWTKILNHPRVTKDKQF